MANFLRMLLGIVLIPLCWGFWRALIDVIVNAAGDRGALSVEAFAMLGGMAVFALCWVLLSHPARAYILGHELTHALWGMLFGAKASDLRVGKDGGSVRLTKSNFIITLAPYFFPFYTFVVIVLAFVTWIFVHPLPWLPVWTFAVGFTWAFHIIFTFDTLSQEQPDVRLYGRLFSWVVILLANLALVLVWLTATTDYSFAKLGHSLWARSISAYGNVFGLFGDTVSRLWNLCVN